MWRRYAHSKSKGAASVKKVDGEIFIVNKRFDPETGDALPDDEREIRLDELTRRKDELETELVEVNDLLTDISALDE